MGMDCRGARKDRSRETCGESKAVFQERDGYGTAQGGVEEAVQCWFDSGFWICNSIQI